MFKNIPKQECIPVGCVPPAHYCKGVSLTETPPDRDPLTESPPDRKPLGQRAPQTETHPLDRDLPGHVTCGVCWDRDPHLR